MRYRTLLTLLVFGLPFFAIAQDQTEPTPAKKRPFGPIIKIEPTGALHHYGKLLLGVEYFVSPVVSIQHQAGPVLSIENFNFSLFNNTDNVRYNNFWGIAFNNEARYYLYNSAEKYGYHATRPVRSAYLGARIDYSYTEIDTYKILGFSCEWDECLYYQKWDETIKRRWFGGGLLVGAQFIFHRRLSLDMNIGFGLRDIRLKRTPEFDETYDRLFEGIESDHFFEDASEVFLVPVESLYPIMGIRLGYSLY